MTPAMQGGAKIIGSTVGSSNIVWRGNWVHDNIGNGLWIDTNVRNVTFESNTIENNTAIGIFYETSFDAVIRNNVLRNNAAEFAGKSCFWGSQIHLNDSQNVEIYGNTVESSDGSNGICAVDIDRATPGSSKVANLYVHDNTVRVRLNGTTGLVGGRAAAYDASANNDFVANTYYVTDISKKAWAWSTLPGRLDPVARLRKRHDRQPSDLVDHPGRGWARAWRRRGPRAFPLLARTC